jgi:hypothetical protein
MEGKYYQVMGFMELRDRGYGIVIDFTEHGCELGQHHALAEQSMHTSLLKALAVIECTTATIQLTPAPI